MISQDQIDAFQAKAKTLLGLPYQLGAKWSIADTDPTTPIDCSGFARWVVHNITGLFLPDGSYNQFSSCDDIEGDPMPMDLGFFKDAKGTVDHVGLIFDDENMIEARGDPYHKVILRPRKAWEAYKLFAGYKRVPGL